MVFNIFYVIQYDIKDLEPYFLLAMMGIAFFGAFGMKLILSRLKNPFILPGLAIFPLMALGINFQASDQSTTRFFETYTEASLGVLEPNALLMTQQWDFLIPPYYYLRLVEGKYPNLMILDKELLRRSWYINKQVLLFEKGIFDGLETEKDEFLKNLKPFEDNKPYNANLIEENYQDLMGKILTTQLKNRPVYLGIECVQNQAIKIPLGYKMVPVGFWLKLVPNQTGYVPAPIPVFKPEFPINWIGKSSNAYYSGFIKDIWQTSCQARAQYELEAGKTSEARNWQQAALME